MFLRIRYYWINPILLNHDFIIVYVVQIAHRNFENEFVQHNLQNVSDKMQLIEQVKAL